MRNREKPKGKEVTFMNPIWSNIISFLSIGVVSAVLLNALRFLLLPHYRLEINRKKHNDDATAFLAYYTDTYKASQSSPKSKFELQKLTNAAFGTRNFNYELIFMLFDRDERDVELKAKEIQKRWFLIKVNYVDKKIRCRIPKQWMNRLAIFSVILYLIFAILVLTMQLGYEWYGLRNFDPTLIQWILVGLILLSAYNMYVLGSLKTLESLIDQ